MSRLLYIIPVTIFMFSMLSCGDSIEKNNGTGNNVESEQPANRITVSKAQFKGGNMELGRLSQQDFPKEVAVTGTIDVSPQNKAIVSAFAGGYIKRTPLLIGNKVKKGQPLLTLENPEFIQMQQDYQESFEQLNFLKSEFERQKSLVAEQISSQKNFLRAESEYKRNLSRYNGLRQKLKMLNISPENVEKGILISEATIFAPIDGSITKVNVNKGMYVSPADEIMEIVNTDHIHLELSVFEKDILKVKKGQKIRFKISEASEEYYAAEVYLVGTSIDADSRTVKVHGHLNDDENHNFAVGMFVEAAIITSNELMDALPTESVVVHDNNQYVLSLVSEKDEEYVLEIRTVGIGESYNGYTAITKKGNLKASDQVIVKGAFYLLGESSESH
ncbi:MULTISPECIES: efflux RND transporter periplasmic adaptor subunit [unclassified Arenibacter]|uniref:efflux RND transporter periplasmic adaptor subunit n=1 Tax=unclassified Arenibacter TaxID=2615047 RepID=UPI000E3500F6|nr:MULTISPECIES: efflux RND transporter periplasmic adaptor subunit [unclassified Arenibacter]MCM4163056.1 efflux transporter periplasmic adaptor subunit [Arenibacter sp. A80]RFT57552.1 efflux RND transporter periplasmic adaptor subunit [Arenibacter sp. P308M17]